MGLSTHIWEVEKDKKRLSFSPKVSLVNHKIFWAVVHIVVPSIPISVGLANVTNIIGVTVSLVVVGHKGAVVTVIGDVVPILIIITGISLAITIRVKLFWVYYSGTVVNSVWYAIAIGIRITVTSIPKAILICINLICITEKTRERGERK